MCGSSGSHAAMGDRGMRHVAQTKGRRVRQRPSGPTLEQLTLRTSSVSPHCQPSCDCDVSASRRGLQIERRTKCKQNRADRRRGLLRRSGGRAMAVAPPRIEGCTAAYCTAERLSWGGTQPAEQLLAGGAAPQRCATNTAAQRAEQAHFAAAFLAACWLLMVSTVARLSRPANRRLKLRAGQGRGMEVSCK